VADRNWPHGGDLEHLQQEYLKGNWHASLDAVVYCRVESKPIPEWAIDGVVAELQIRYWDEDHPQSARDRLRARRQLVDKSIYDVVKIMRGTGLTWAQSYNEAATGLKMTPDQIKNAYVRCNKRTKQFESRVPRIGPGEEIVFLANGDTIRYRPNGDVTRIQTEADH
jgi:hypothetical protein